MAEEPHVTCVILQRLPVYLYEQNVKNGVLLGPW